jgi:hypothetical protein
MWKKTLQIGLLLALVLSSVFSSAAYMDSTRGEESSSAVIQRFSERIQKRTHSLPFSRGVLGYLSDEHVAGIDHDADNEDIEYVLAQYAVIPLILNKGVYHEWNILNMSVEAYEAWLAAHGAEYRLVSSGGGFYLVQRLP